MLVSIHLNSNQPEQIGVFFDSIEHTATDASRIEVLVNIDEGDEVMARILEQEITQRKFHLRYTQTALPGGFFDLWKPLNKLYQMTHPEAYYLLNVSDEFLFETPGWDDIIAGYMGYYPDNIFRLRCSQFRFRNYQDLWECGFAPDSLAFYTRKWLEAGKPGEEWNPCFGPDSFQQCVAYYLYTTDAFSMKQYHRDIGVPNIHFSGEGASIGLSEEANLRRTRGHVRTWMILMSPHMQKKAKRCAMWLKANIVAHENHIKQSNIIDQPRWQRIAVRDENTGLSNYFSYRINWLKMQLTNLWRRNLYHYYAGGGQNAAIMSPIPGFRFYMWARYDWAYRLGEYDWLFPYLVARVVAVKRLIRARTLHHGASLKRRRLNHSSKTVVSHRGLGSLIPSFTKLYIGCSRSFNACKEKSGQLRRATPNSKSARVKRIILLIFKRSLFKALEIVCIVMLIPVEIVRAAVKYFRKTQQKKVAQRKQTLLEHKPEAKTAP